MFTEISIGLKNIGNKNAIKFECKKTQPPPHTGREWSENSHRGEKCDYSKMNFCQLYVIVDHFWLWLWL